MNTQTRNLEIEPETHQPQSPSHKDNCLHCDPALLQKFVEISSDLQTKALERLVPNSQRYLATLEHVRQMRANLLKEGDSPIELVLIDAIITNYLYSGVTGLGLAVSEDETFFLRKANRKQTIHDRANQRMMKSIQLLTNVRSLYAREDCKQANKQKLPARSS
jgi:hypothetical protein